MPRRNQGPRLKWLEKRGCFYIVWSEDGRSRERSTGSRDRAEAEIALAQFLQARKRYTGPRDPSEILITEILDAYGAERGPEVASPERIAWAIEALVPFWTGKAAAAVNRETCLAYAAHRIAAERQRSLDAGRDPRGVSDGTIRRELGVLRAAINHAHREGRVTRAPFVALPERPQARDRWLTPAEAERLLKAAYSMKRARGHLPLFIRLGLMHGARKEAILSLRWAQVDLDAGLIDFNPPGRKRTNKRRSRVPIARGLIPFLRIARRRSCITGHVIQYAGKPVRDIKRAFGEACRIAALEDVTPHTLRHTCATWMMQRGVPHFEACGFLEMSPETLQRHYAHHHPDYLRSAANAF
ncbi:MAG: site-specific integrase [Oceanicaulis sp.]|nr:site-specific integrase [Oceanicaulis sp.]